MEATQASSRPRVPWNKGKLVGQKAPFKPKDVWAMRARMQQEHRSRDLAMLNLGIDSKLRGCDLVALKVRDIQHGGQVAPRAIVVQHKTGRPVQFEILGNSLVCLRDFPEDARQDAGYQLDQVQRGRQPTDFKPMATVGKGVEELRVWDDSGTYRVIYVARLKDAI